jgi:hypothetical protein
MKAIRLRRLLCAALLLAAGLRVLNAQDYVIDWATVDSGGGTSTDSVYSVSGTIGQPEAGGPLTVDDFSLVGGFWAILDSGESPNSRVLSIALTATNTVLISWPSPNAGLVLQQNAELTTANWTDVAQTPADDGTTVSLVLPLSGGATYFRLRR